MYVCMYCMYNVHCTVQYCMYGIDVYQQKVFQNIPTKVLVEIFV